MNHAFVYPSFPSLPPLTLDLHTLAVAAAVSTGLFVLFLVLALRGGTRAARPGDGDPRVARLAKKGLTASAIASRTGLSQDAVRALLAAQGARRSTLAPAPRVPATRKFVPDEPAGPVLAVAAAGAGARPDAPFAARLNAALARGLTRGTRVA